MHNPYEYTVNLRKAQKPQGNVEMFSEKIVLGIWRVGLYFLLYNELTV